MKYRGPGAVGYGVEFTRSAYNEDDGAYEYKQRDNISSKHRSVLPITCTSRPTESNEYTRILLLKDTSFLIAQQNKWWLRCNLYYGRWRSLVFDKAEGEDLEFSIGAGIAW